MNRFRFCMFSVMLLGGLATSSVLLRADELDKVYELKGTPVQGKILEISETTVTIDVNSLKRELPVNEIKRVQFAEEPTELVTARNYITQGSFQNARATLDKIDKKDLEDLKNDFIKGDIAYYHAYASAQLALRGEGDGDADAAKDAARAELSAYLSTFGGAKRHHFFEIAQVMGDLAASQGKYDAAIKAYSMIGKAPWPEYQLRAQVLTAQCLQGQEKYTEALAKYEEILAKQVSAPEAVKQQAFAKLGRAVCIAGAGKPEDGIKIATEIIEKSDAAKEPLLFARAYNALGACYQKAGKPKDAIQAYLHTQLMFSQDPESHAEALYNLFILWRAERKSNYSLRAKDDLLQRYGGSLWAGKAKAAK